MAKKQITDLDELTEISSDDLLLSRDVSEAEDNHHLELNQRHQ